MCWTREPWPDHPSPAIVLKQPPRLGTSVASSWLRVFRAPTSLFLFLLWLSLICTQGPPSAVPVKMKSLEPEVELMSAGSHGSLHLEALDGYNTRHEVELACLPGLNRFFSRPSPPVHASTMSLYSAYFQRPTRVISGRAVTQYTVQKKDGLHFHVVDPEWRPLAWRRLR